MDQANYVRPMELVETVLQGTASPFSCIPTAPIFPRQGPAKFESRPPGRVQKAYSPHKIAAGFFFHGPGTIIKKLPMSNNESHVTPGLEAIKCLAAEKPHYFRISRELGVGLEVCFAKHAKYQTLGFQNDLIQNKSP